MAPSVKTVGRTAVLLLACQGAGQLAAQAPEAPRRLTVDDLFAIERIGDVEPSPDGEWVAYVHIRAKRTASGFKRDFMGGADHADVWIAPSSGGAPRRITDGAADGSGYFAPVWSPDSRRLALLSTKSGNVHLWAWDRVTGELRQVIRDRANAAIFAADIVWTSSTHLVTALLPPGQSPASLIVEKLPALTAMQAWPKAWDGRETTASVLEAGPGAQRTAGRTRELHLVDVDRASSRPIASGDIAEFAVSPDRRRIAVARRVATYRPAPDARIGELRTRERFEVDVMVADGTELWTAIEGIGELRTAFGAPQLLWSDDGAQMAVFACPPAGGARDDRLVRIRVDARRVEDVTPANLDLAGASAIWAADGRLLLHAMSRSGDRRESRSDWWQVDGAAEARNLTAALSAAPSRLVRTADGSVLIGVAASAVWRIPLDGSTPTNLTAGSPTKHAAIAWPTDSRIRTAAVIVAGADERADAFHRLDVASGQITALPPVAAGARLVAGHVDGRSAYFVADGNAGTSLAVVRDGAPPTPIASLNTFLAEIVPGDVRRIDYRTTDGKEVGGWLLLPPGHEQGRRCPLLVWVYAGSMMGRRPPGLASLNLPEPFNMQVAAARGYAVLFPSMPLAPPPEFAGGAPSDPFLDLPKGVLPAVDKAIDLGIADPKRIAVMGHSYGGYSAMALIAQTDRFAAAIALAGASNLVSLYGQFETREAMSDDRMQLAGRDGYYLFWSEDGQGRMGGPPWKDLQRYIRNSPITYADRIRTPLMLVLGDMDITGMQQGEEMFTALYRQDKPARFVRYWGEGHILDSPANIRDFWARSFDWFERHFRAAVEARPEETRK